MFAFTVAVKIGPTHYGVCIAVYTYVQSRLGARVNQVTYRAATTDKRLFGEVARGSEERRGIWAELSKDLEIGRR